VILALIKVILALIKNKVPIEITWSPDIPWNSYPKCTLSGSRRITRCKTSISRFRDEGRVQSLGLRVEGLLPVPLVSTALCIIHTASPLGLSTVQRAPRATYTLSKYTSLNSRD
jgi:hypothetical protein